MIFENRMSAPSADNKPLVALRDSRKLRRVTPLLLALIVQGVLLVVTAFIAVVIPSQKSEPEFVASPAIHLPQRELEHRMALAEFEQMTASPPAIERLMTETLLPDGLPALPSLPDLASDSLEFSETAPVDARDLFG